MCKFWTSKGVQFLISYPSVAGTPETELQTVFLEMLLKPISTSLTIKTEKQKNLHWESAVSLGSYFVYRILCGSGKHL